MFSFCCNLKKNGELNNALDFLSLGDATPNPFLSLDTRVCGVLTWTIFVPPSLKRCPPCDVLMISLYLFDHQMGTAEAQLLPSVHRFLAKHGAPQVFRRVQRKLRLLSGIDLQKNYFFFDFATTAVYDTTQLNACKHLI